MEPYGKCNSDVRRNDGHGTGGQCIQGDHKRLPVSLRLRQMVPKSRGDVFAFVTSLFGINGMFLYEVFYILPWVVSNSGAEGYSSFKWYMHVISAVILHVNAMYCFWKVISTETSTVGIVLPSILKPEWRYCYKCECNAPPRSYHCYLCKRCILRRDHHCIFTGNCIGLNNHRFYLMLLFNTWLASLYANIMNIDFVSETIGMASILSVFKLLFPFVMCLIGMLDVVHTLTAAMNLFCIASTCTITALLAYHLRNLYYNQITTERTHNVFKYNIGWRENVRSVFGERWAISWIFPWIPSPLPGNGLEFPLSSKYESPKDI